MIPRPAPESKGGKAHERNNTFDEQTEQGILQNKYHCEKSS